MPKVTIYKTLGEVRGGFTKDINYIYERIRTGSKSKELIERIRNSQDETEQKELKKQLPVINFQGIFKERNDKGLKEFSGLMPLDFDNFPNVEELQSLREILLKDEYTHALFVSPRGNGLKLIVRIPLDGAENYKAYFDSLKEYYNNPYFDISNSNLSRLCFESYDPDMYINDNSIIYTKSIEIEYTEIGTSEPIFRETSDNRIINNLLIWWNKNFGHNKGSRNTNLFKLAMALNTYGVGEREALSTLLTFKENDFTENEITTLCRSAYNNTQIHNSRWFENVEVRKKVEKQIRAGKTNKDIIRAMPEVEAKKIEEISTLIKNNIEIQDFWDYTDKGKVVLTPHKYKYWLENNNFCKYFPTESATYTFVHIEQNKVSETYVDRIKDYVLKILLERTDIGMLPFDHMAASEKAFNPKFLSMLESVNIKFKEDTQTECFLYYKNCVVRVTANSVDMIDYLDMDGYVWENRIINRDYVECDHHDAEIRKFVWLISGEGAENEHVGNSRYRTFKSVIGYLLHGFKTSANNKAIIFNDSVISENPNGGSGKGILWNAFKYLKKVNFLDGKLFKFEKSFPYQTVPMDCQILVFDDVKRNFAFENLFSLITEGITLEYKGQDAVLIPVERSPKIVITTNYTIGGIGGSFERRKFEVEFTSYFNYKHTAEQEFGHMLYSGWDSLEWSKFDSFMIQCIQFYLRHGLVKTDFENIEMRKFIKNTSFEFYEWTKKHDAIPFNANAKKKEYFDNFLEEYQDLKKWLSQKKFKQWVESYCQMYGFVYDEIVHPFDGRCFHLKRQVMNVSVLGDDGNYTTEDVYDPKFSW